MEGQNEWKYMHGIPDLFVTVFDVPQLCAIERMHINVAACWGTRHLFMASKLGALPQELQRK